MMPPTSPPDSEPTPLAKKLAARIAANGAIALYDYMDACLCDPVHGYYKKSDPLGRQGDFITAPEISQVFGELAGLWAGETWRIMGSPAGLRLIELGPGRGALLADALRALRVLPGFLGGAAVHLVETSTALRAAQAAALANAPCSIFWHERIEEVPAGPSIAIANEFFDCLPVRQFAFESATQLWRERMVGFQGGSFRFELSPDGFKNPPHPCPTPAIGEGSIEDGAIVEARPGTAEILGAFAVRGAPFAALIVDYGYAKPSFGDTVQAVKAHRFLGLFDAPGESDLTAHVDFSELAQTAQKLNLAAFGPMPMGEWLLRLGLEARMRQLLSRASPEAQTELRGRISRLVDPAQMGALFKVVALTGGGLGPLPPFSW